MVTPEIIYCPAMTHPGSRYIDPEPPEFCDNEVEDHGDFCADHEESDDRDWGD